MKVNREDLEAEIEELEDQKLDYKATLELDPSSFRIHSEILVIGDILDMITEKELILPSVLEAGHQWSYPLQSRLIESLLLRLPLPTFYFDSSVDGIWRVVDGVHRLFAIRDFVNLVYPLECLEYFRDKSTDKSFDALAPYQRRRILETYISVQVIDCKVSKCVKANIFERVRRPEYLESNDIYRRKKYLNYVGE